jgi:hypothetical protein
MRAMNVKIVKSNFISRSISSCIILYSHKLVLLILTSFELEGGSGLGLELGDVF